MPGDLRLRMLGNNEVLEKSQNCMGRQPCVQWSLQKKDFGTSAHKTRKSRFQNFTVLSNFAWFLNSSQIFCTRLSIERNANLKLVLVPLNCQSLTLFVTPKSFWRLSRKIEQTNSEKLPNLEGLCKPHLASWI